MIAPKGIVCITMFAAVSLPTTLLAETHSITSQDAVTSVHDPRTGETYCATCATNIEKSSMVLVWVEGKPGTDAGLMRIVVHPATPPTNKYEVILELVKYSTDDELEGLFTIKENNVVLLSQASGQMENLSSGLGGIVKLKIEDPAFGDWEFDIVISQSFSGLKGPEDIVTQLFNNGVELSDHDCRLVRPNGTTRDITTGNSICKFTFETEMRRLRLVFKNWSNPMKITGTVSVGGEPAAGYLVLIRRQGGDKQILHAATTDENGEIPGKKITDQQGNKIKVVIVNPRP